jgi:hypothetical protein
VEKKRSRMNLSIGQVVAKGSSIDLKQTRDAFYFKVLSEVHIIIHKYYYSLMTFLYCATSILTMKDTTIDQLLHKRGVIESNTG